MEYFAQYMPYEGIYLFLSLYSAYIIRNIATFYRPISYLKLQNVEYH